jgi:hypothetical protein
MIDGKALSLSDVDRKFIATNSSSLDLKSKTNPEKALVRFQFMEVLARIAERKYIEGGVTKSHSEACKLLFQDGVLDVIGRYDAHKWRERYWNEQCDGIYKAYVPVLQYLYKKYSGARTQPGKTKFMSLDEFKKLCKDLDLFSEQFVERDPDIFFCMSMQTVIDEIYTTRGQEMMFIEFMEAFARTADKAGTLPPEVDVR